MESTSNYLGGTSFTNKSGTEELTVMIEEVTEESSSSPIYVVSSHSENKKQRTNEIHSRWFETQEEAEKLFQARVNLLEKSSWWVRESYID